MCCTSSWEADKSLLNPLVMTELVCVHHLCSVSLLSLVELDRLQVNECFILSLESLILVFHPFASSSLPPVTLLQSPILSIPSHLFFVCSVFFIGTPHLSIASHCQLLTSPHVSPYSQSFLVECLSSQETFLLLGGSWSWVRSVFCHSCAFLVPASHLATSRHAEEYHILFFLSVPYSLRRREGRRAKEMERREAGRVWPDAERSWWSTW